MKITLSVVALAALLSGLVAAQNPPPTVDRTGKGLAKKNGVEAVVNILYMSDGTVRWEPIP